MHMKIVHFGVLKILLVLDNIDNGFLHHTVLPYHIFMMRFIQFKIGILRVN